MAKFIANSIQLIDKFEIFLLTTSFTRCFFMHKELNYLRVLKFAQLCISRMWHRLKVDRLGPFIKKQYNCKHDSNRLNLLEDLLLKVA